MGIVSIVTDTTGQVNVNPRRVKIITTDNLAAVTTAGYLNTTALSTYPIYPTDIFDIDYSYVQATNTGTYGEFTPSFSGGIVTLLQAAISGVTLPTIANHIATYTNTAGHLAEDAATAINGGNIQAGLSGTAGTLTSFPGTASNGSFIIKAINNSGGFATTLSNTNVGQATVYSLPDPGAATGQLTVVTGALVSGNILSASGTAGKLADSGIAASSLVVTSNNTGQIVTATSSSATPGTQRSLTGKVINTNATYANGSNSIAGVRGEADIVGASSGFVYGVQGKVIPTGTLSGSIWAPAVFGQYDLSGATINAGQIAAIWGDMGATGGTFTNVTGARMFAGTNTIATLTLNSMIYLYGKATNLLELSGSSSTYISSGGSGAPGGTVQKLAITIDGTTYYIVASTTVT